jgi:hypothetical protein
VDTVAEAGVAVSVVADVVGVAAVGVAVVVGDSVVLPLSLLHAQNARTIASAKIMQRTERYFFIAYPPFNNMNNVSIVFNGSKE